MLNCEIKTAINGCKYLRIQKANGKAFCIFDTQDWLISYIYGEIQNYLYNDCDFDYLNSYYGIDLETLFNICTIDLYPIFKTSYDNRWKIKKEINEYWNRMNLIDDPYECSVVHEKPDLCYLFCDEEWEMCNDRGILD